MFTQAILFGGGAFLLGWGLLLAGGNVAIIAPLNDVPNDEWTEKNLRDARRALFGLAFGIVFNILGAFLWAVAGSL